MQIIQFTFAQTDKQEVDINLRIFRARWLQRWVVEIDKSSITYNSSSLNFLEKRHIFCFRLWPTCCRHFVWLLLLFQFIDMDRVRKVVVSGKRRLRKEKKILSAWFCSVVAGAFSSSRQKRDYAARPINRARHKFGHYAAKWYRTIFQIHTYDRTGF